MSHADFEASWVHVTHLLPEPNANVLAYIHWTVPEVTAEIVIAWWSPDHGSFMHAEHNEVEVSHWMLLPPEPR